MAGMPAWQTAPFRRFVRRPGTSARTVVPAYLWRRLSPSLRPAAATTTGPGTDGQTEGKYRREML
jgi:hypothetical protein